MQIGADRIIIISHMYPRVGAPMSGTFVRELVRGMKKVADPDLIVIVPVPWWPQWLPLGHWKKYIGQPQFEVIEGIPHYFVRYPVLPGQNCFPLQGYGMIWAVGSLLQKLHQPEVRTILHSHALLPDGYAGANLARRFGYIHVCTLHGSDVNIYPHRTSWTYRQSVQVMGGDTAFIAVSNAIARRALAIATAKRITVIHNGADESRFHVMDRSAVCRELGLDPDRRYAIFVGNMLPVKGVDLLLQAFAMAKKDGTELLLIGEGEKRTSYMSLAKHLGINDSVRFIGYVPHEDIPLWLNAADLLILASRSEGFPTIIPEAMMCGLPVIGTDVGGVSDAVINGKTGILVSPEDIKQLSTAIEILLNDELQRSKLAFGAIDFARDLTWKAIALSTLRYYSEVNKNEYT